MSGRKAQTPCPGIHTRPLPPPPIPARDATTKKGVLSGAALEGLFDAVEWMEFVREEGWEPGPGELYATHSGVLRVPLFGELRVYQLNDGQRVVDADDLTRALGLAEG